MGLPLEPSRAGFRLEVVPIPLGAMILLGFALVLANAFFVAAEYAIATIRTGRLLVLAQQGHGRARAVRAMAVSSKEYLSACQLGITLTSLGLGLLGAPAVSELFKPDLTRMGFSEAVIYGGSVAVSFLVVTAVHFVIGGQLPRIYSKRKAEVVVMWVALPLHMFCKLVKPFHWVLRRLVDGLLGKAGEETAETGEAVHSGEELRHLMKESRNKGMLDHTEFALADNIFGFSDTTAREIMIPRTEMVCLYADLTYQENMAIAKSELLTRYPVCAPDKDNIIGFLHIKDLLQTEAFRHDIKSVIRPLMSVPDSIPISVLLQQMQKRRTQIALLIDEYGGTAGLVTVEDILEEIVGEIQDEFDEERPAIERVGEEVYSVDGLLLIEEVNERLGLRIFSEEYDTLGGWLYSQLESPPDRNQMIRLGAHELLVEEVDHLRISRVLIREAGAQEEGETVA